MLYVFFLPHYFTLFFQNTNYKNAVSSLQSSSSLSSLHSFQTAFICLIFFLPLISWALKAHILSPSIILIHFILILETLVGVFILHYWLIAYIFKCKYISPQFLHSPLQHIYKEYSSSVIFPLSSWFLILFSYRQLLY